MTQRPAHLTPENAAAFRIPSVVDAYPLRLPYPVDVFEVLTELIVDEPRAVLDIGTGTGVIAREMTMRADRVDAVDVSPEMIARGKTLVGGDAPNLNWILGQAEDVPLSPPYALVTAGESLHWMNWEVLLPRLSRSLTPRGSLAIVDRSELDPPWHESLTDLLRAYSTLGTYEEYDLIELLTSRGLFRPAGQVTVSVQRAQQPVKDYVRSFHSRSSLSAEGLGCEGTRAFDERLCEIVGPWTKDGAIALEWAPTVVYGRPLER